MEKKANLGYIMDHTQSLPLYRAKSTVSLNTGNKLNVYKTFTQGYVNGVIYKGDVLKFLHSLPAGSADIVFLDPPFNLGKKYSSKLPKMDMKNVEEYFKWICMILEESIRVMAPGASLFLYHTPLWALRFGNHLMNYLTFKHLIAISMKNGFVRGNRLYPAHYSLLYFTKGKPSYFIRPKIRPVSCKHCGKTVKDYGGYSKIINDNGINLSDFWEDLSPVRHANKKLRPQNQLPIEMLRRIVEISGTKGMTFIDPFAGTGTGIIAAIEFGLSFQACDLLASNCKIIVSRIEKNSYEEGV